MLARSPKLILALAVALAVLVAVPVGAAAKPLKKATWLGGTTITEYYPVPESWFHGALVSAPGMPGRHRIDWLYSGTGLSMEGDGVGIDGRQYHIEDTGGGGWVNAAGKRTVPGKHGWSRGTPFWRAGGFWRNAGGRLTFPLLSGDWSAGAGARYVSLPGVRFAAGPSRPLTYYASVAVDPRLIPLGSKIFIPAYASITPSHGWFTAADTGGAILGRHLDVYRPPPVSPDGGARYLTRQRIRVIPPGVRP